MSIDELLVTVQAIREKEKSERTFTAAVNGIDLEQQQSELEDITTLKGRQANQEGFGIGQGIGAIELG